MATHSRYADTKKWPETTNRRSIQLRLPKHTVDVLDRLCRERGVKLAELLDSLINAASREANTAREAERLPLLPL